jgi:hypothetical protein
MKEKIMIKIIHISRLIRHFKAKGPAPQAGHAKKKKLEIRK